MKVAVLSTASTSGKEAYKKRLLNLKKMVTKFLRHRTIGSLLKTVVLPCGILERFCSISHMLMCYILPEK